MGITMTLDVEAVVSGARAGGHGAGVREEVERLLERMRDYPWRRSTGKVQSEPGEVPTMIGRDDLGSHELAVLSTSRFWPSRRQTGGHL